MIAMKSLTSKYLLDLLKPSFTLPLNAFKIAFSAIVAFSPFVSASENFLITQKDVTSNTKPASSTDTFLYRQLGVNFLCRARMADVEFPKALGIASATFADVISQKHGGFVEELPDKKLTAKQLYLSAEIQIIEGAIKFCPDNVPSEAKDKFEEFVKTETKKNKKKKRK